MRGTKDFENETDRQVFVRNVYVILTCQLLVAVCVIAVFLFYKPASDAVRHDWVLYLSLSLMCVVWVVFALGANSLRQYPLNISALVVYTGAVSFCIGCISSTFQSEEIFVALCIADIVCFSISLFTIQTKLKFSLSSGIIHICVIIVITSGIIYFFTQNHQQQFSLLYVSLGAFALCLYLVCDTVMLIDGRCLYYVLPTECVYSALSLYLDVINIFIYVFKLLRKPKRTM